MFRISAKKRWRSAEFNVLKCALESRNRLSSCSPADDQLGARWYGVGLGAGVGGEAGAEGSRFGGIAVADLPGVGRGLG